MKSNIISSRELEILSLIIHEYTTSEIATKLCLSSETIRTHRKHLFFKLQVRNAPGLVRKAFETGLAKIGLPS